MATTIWIGTAEAKGGYGGWCWLRLAGEDSRGVAGGDRRSTPVAMALTAALEALAETPPGPVILRCALAGQLGGPIDDSTPDELALFARLSKARPHPRTIQPVGAGHEAEFVAAWAAFAMDIAKTKGQFSSPVPKPNLKGLIAKL